MPVTFREIASPHGHDSFLLAVPEYHRTVRTFLDAHGARGRRVRPDLDLVAGMVPPRLARARPRLRRRRPARAPDPRAAARATASRSSADGFDACVARGVPVVQADIDARPRRVRRPAFDVVVLSQTLQATHRPALVLREMMRVGRARHRVVPELRPLAAARGLALRGRMPSRAPLPYAWYDTPNIHLCTLRDFERMAAEQEVRIARRIALDERGRQLRGAAERRPNLLAAGAVYLVER